VTVPEKWGPEPDSIVVIASGRSDDEIKEALARIERGEDATAVWAEIDERVAKRERQRLGME